MRALRLLSWTAVAAVLALLLWRNWYGPDIWYHLYLGGRIAATHAAQPADQLILRQPGFLNFYWLFQLAVRGAWGLGGRAAVSALLAAVWTGALLCWLSTAGLVRRGPWAPLLTLAALVICQLRFEPRPEAFSYLFLALQVRWLAAWPQERSPAPGGSARFLAVQLLWSNMHGYFALGPLLIVLRLAAARRREEAKGLGLLLGLTLLASVASPFGWRNWAGVATLWNFLGVMRLEIQEFLPPLAAPAIGLWPVKLFAVAAAALALAALRLLCAAPRRHLFAVLLAALGLFLGLQALRNVPLLVFCSGPLLAAAWHPAGARAAAEGPIRLGAAGVAAALGVWIAVGGFYRSFGTLAAFGPGESRAAFPIGFAGYLRARGFGGAIFERAADGGYLEFHFPALRLFGDTRFTDAALVREYFRATTDSSAFREVNRRYGFEGVLLDVVESRGVVTALLRGPRWLLAYADLHRAFLVDRGTPAGAAAVAAAPEFYAGEDLTDARERAAALQWIALLDEAGDRADLVRLLRQFGAAPRVPAAVMELALSLGLRSGDTEMIAAARELRPRLAAASPTEAATVDWLLRRPPP